MEGFMPWLLLAIIAPMLGYVGYVFYRWREDISFEKKHRSPLAKKRSLEKLKWGFRIIMGILSFPPFMYALFMRGEYLLLLFPAGMALAFWLGGEWRRAHAEERYRVQYADADPLGEQPKKAA